MITHSIFEQNGNLQKNIADNVPIIAAIEIVSNGIEDGIDFKYTIVSYDENNIIGIYNSETFIEKYYGE